jgi:IS4 transposase
MTGTLPSYAVITEGRQHEVTVAKTLTFAPGTILVIGRGYVEDAWFAALTLQRVFFVTRLKDNAVYTVVGTREVSAHRGIVTDELIELTGVGAAAKCPYALRRVAVEDPDTGDPVVFLTNHLAFGATTIAAIYKDRWQIELLFKALKQHCKIKTFVGTSATALHTQIWTALIALQLRSTFGWSLSNLLALLQFQLFTHRNLWAWLNEPFTGPPTIEPVEQLVLTAVA